MPLRGSLIEQLSFRLSAHLGRPVDIEREVPVGGGSINDAFRLDTNEGRFFVKVNSADRFPSMFAAEADGLERLRNAAALRIPQVIAHGEDHDDAYLLLEHIDAGPKNDPFWERLGRGLARLHAHHQPEFGLEVNNYMGSLKQVNTPHSTWEAFFIECRLEPQVKMARDRKRLNMADVLRFERLYAEVPSIFPKEAPALLHGDLWSSNLMCDADSVPVLIDPAVYFGHVEMDLAMSRLFGGFEPAFYEAYQNERPLAKGWEQRMDVCNLYPLLVHVNLFGGPYAQQVHTIVARFA